MVKHALSLFRDRWQAPLAILVLVLGGISIYRLTPKRIEMPFDALLASLQDLRMHGGATEAADGAANLLKLEPPLPKKEQAELHVLIADIVHERLDKAARPGAEAAQLVLDHIQAARELGRRVTDRERIEEADAYRWLEKPFEAASGYRRVADGESPSDIRRAALMKLVPLLETMRKAEDERKKRLAQILDMPDAPTEAIWWALQRSVRDALESNDLDFARELVDQHGDRLRTTDLRGYETYLDALLLVTEKRYAEAAPLVEWVDDWLANEPLRDVLMDEFGHLPAMNHWLAGTIALAEDKPATALERFQSSEAIQPVGPMYFAASAGKGEALARLERHADALEALTGAASKIVRARIDDRKKRDFRDTLERLYLLAEASELYEVAAEYLKLALPLAPADEPEPRLTWFEALGQAYRTAALAETDPPRRSHLLAEAGLALTEAARIAVFDEARHGKLLWTAAETLDEAGRISELAAALHRFLAGRSNDPRLPQAMLRLGMAYESLGRPKDAISYYRRCADEYPELEEATSASVRTATCLFSAAIGQADAAEAELEKLLTSEMITPEAPAFRDALLTLGELKHADGRYAEAVAYLESFLERYPEDAVRTRAKFMLADANRLSGLALKADASADADSPARLDEARARLYRAVELYRTVRSETDPRAEDAGAQLYRRLALIAEADCLAAIPNDANALDAAIARFRQAAAEYENTSMALTAQVRLAGLYLRQGERVEAARALERCRWLTSAITDEAFARSDDGATRAEWTSYLDTLTSSLLFRDAFAAR